MICLARKQRAETHYDIQASALKASFGIDVDTRSKALQNVVWSMSVQHNHGTQSIVKNALAGRKASQGKFMKPVLALV